MICNTDKIDLVGIICGGFEYSHTSSQEKFYFVYVSSIRKSGLEDVLPVLVSDKLVDINQDLTGMRVEVIGSIRTYNYSENEKNHLQVYVFADIFRETEKYDYNRVTLTGTICKKPYYRQTPKERQITDILLAVNMPKGKSYYIPLITWSRNAVFVSGMQPGDKLSIHGRLQSRIYHKVTDDGQIEMVAYEVSAYKICLEEEIEGNDHEKA